MKRCSRTWTCIANTPIHFGLIDIAGESYEAPVEDLAVARKAYGVEETQFVAFVRRLIHDCVILLVIITYRS